RVDELLENDLAGQRLRGPDHRREVELLDRRADRRPNRQGSGRLAEMRPRGVELSHLAGGAPAQVAVPRVPQVRVRDRLEPARGVEAGRALVRERLVLNEPVLAREANGLLVAAFRVELPAVEACDLCGDQRGAIREVLGTAPRKARELRLVRGDLLDVPG